MDGLSVLGWVTWAAPVRIHHTDRGAIPALSRALVYLLTGAGIDGQGPLTPPLTIFES